MLMMLVPAHSCPSSVVSFRHCDFFSFLEYVEWRHSKYGISRQVCRAHIAIDDNDKWKDDDQIGQPEGPCCSQLLRNKNKVRCSVLLLRWRNPPPTWDIQSQRKNRQHPHISVKGSLSDTYTFTLLHYKKAPLLFGCPIVFQNENWHHPHTIIILTTLNCRCQQCFPCRRCCNCWSSRTLGFPPGCFPPWWW